MFSGMKWLSTASISRIGDVDAPSDSINADDLLTNFLKKAAAT